MNMIYGSNKHFTRLAQVCEETDVRSNIRLRDAIHREWFESCVMAIECHCVVSLHSDVLPSVCSIISCIYQGAMS